MYYARQGVALWLCSCVICIFMYYAGDVVYSKLRVHGEELLLHLWKNSTSKSQHVYKQKNEWD